MSDRTIDAQIEDLKNPQDLGEVGVIVINHTYLDLISNILHKLTDNNSFPIPYLYPTYESTVLAEWPIKFGVILCDFFESEIMINVVGEKAEDFNFFKIFNYNQVDDFVIWIRQQSVRFNCHFLIDAIPKEGLAEVEKELEEIKEYYLDLAKIKISLKASQ